MPRKSAVERRSRQIAAQLEHLRTQLAKKSRKDYTSDFRHRIWLKKSHELIAELLNELSALNEPGEYDALPAAIIADELNLRLDEIQLLIRRGEIITTGKPAHERISREELGRLAELGPAELMRLSSQDADTVFKEAVNRLRGGDVVAAKRSYGRLIGRESLISPHALAAEIAIKLAMGKYEEAHRGGRLPRGRRRHRTLPPVFYDT